MDASDEFRFVVVNERLCNSHKKQTSESCTENLRNVPVSLYNTNKNLKLRFFWDKAFKLFHSHRTVYKAVSGINYQDYCRSTSNRDRSIRSPGISLRAKSLSHSHLSELGKVMELPAGRSQGRGDGENHTFGQNPTKSIVDIGKKKSDEIAFEEFQEQDITSTTVPVAMPRKRIASRSRVGGIASGRNSTPIASITTSKRCLQRPVSISGGEKPQGDEGRMNDNCISTGNNNIRIPPVPVHLRRTQSINSRCSVDSLLNCHNNNDNDNCVVGSTASSVNRKNKNRSLADSNFKSSFDRKYSSPCPDGISLCTTSDREGDYYNSDCSLEATSNLDSGLDTWKARCSSASPVMKPRDSSTIVCTISQKIHFEVNENGTSEASELSKLNRNSDSRSSCQKMNCNNIPGSGNTTVVLINGCCVSEHSQNSIQYDSFNLSDYDFECMSEIDLNSDPGSGSGNSSSAGRISGSGRDELPNDNGEKYLLCQQSCENELDSLDLTLFEAARKAESAYCLTMKNISVTQKDEPLYDTVSFSSEGTGCKFVENSSAGDTSYLNAWSDAASEFEFMSPSTALNRDILMGHTPRGNPPEVDWEPYFCVLNQLDQIFTAYRSEEMSLTDNGGSSPAEVPRVRLDGGPSSIKCLINNAKWGMNTLLEEEEDSTMFHGIPNEKEKAGDSSSSSIHRNSSPLDTSYDKACSSAERRSSAPLTPILGRETPSRFANFFSKRSFKSNPLKRTKSVTKLERKKPIGTEPENNMLYPSRLRTSRSHESLLAWTNHSVSSLVNNGMMSTMDLAGGNVTIRPLHPSVLGQDFAFQISTPAGSKYYLCSSASERDAWVYALRQAIKPHANEIRRQDNSLKLWILEAKGIAGSGKSSSKRYFCELYLDDVLYARTCAKPKGEMLFWGEHFEFAQLPSCVQLITVVLFREGDKKKKKERNTCIGRVKIPMNSVNSRYLIEKWYPVIPDAASLIGKDKELPSMRVKCKYQSVDILPVRCYKPFLQYIKDEYGPVSECLESVLSVKAKEDLASALVHVLHHEGIAKEFIAELALQEILKSGDEKLTFRGNSIATKSMEAFLKLTGTEYLHASLGPFIEHFQRSEDVCDCEVDPMKLSVGVDLSKNQQNLRMAVDTVWKSILHSHSIFPIELRECFSHCRESLRTAGKEELSDHLISASIFLRFLCPAVLSPSLFNITNEYPTEKSARNLTLVAKVLQTLANFTRFQGKESYMEFINDFVEKEAPSMKAFLSCISSPLSSEVSKKSQPRDKVPAGGFIDLGKHASILSTLLGENVAKIAPKNDRFKPLQEILETIHLWLKQPANATNVSLFPFPHVATPAPTIPPPPAPIGMPVNHRGSIPLNNSQALNHQYQIPNTATPIYAVSNVIHNNANPKVKNISHMNANWNGNGHQLPLQLQIPSVNNAQLMLNNNQRSGSQASSGYQSQSPVLEGEDKNKQLLAKENINLQIMNLNALRATEMQEPGTALTFSNPVFSRKSGSQSVDDLSSLGVDLINESAYRRRLARSSSSSDCEEPPDNGLPTKSRPRSGPQKDLYSNIQHSNQAKSHVKTSNHRLSRRSSAELLRKNHPYSSSTDEDSDNIRVNERQEVTPQLPPRRGLIKRSAGYRPNLDASSVKSHEEARQSFTDDMLGINCSEYEREMVELRRAMEALQTKLSRAEERLFGQEGNGQHIRRESDRGGSIPSPILHGIGPVGNERLSKGAEENAREMDNLLQRLLTAEEEMKREQELLVALDRKQELIDAQEQKIARLDSVNNQLLEALSQIRDSLQQQHVQQQQQKIQQQLLKQQQHLQQLSSSLHGNRSISCSTFPQNTANRNPVSYDRIINRRHHVEPSQVYQSINRSNSINNINNKPTNTTKVLITSGNNENVQSCNSDNNNEPNRNSAAYIGEQALKMLAELKSSSC